MPVFGMDIRSLYFSYRPVASHDGGCSRAGTDVWEATWFTWEGFSGEVRETTFRFACGECGAVAFQSVDGPVPHVNRTHASRVGFGSRPERVAGLWLHPGPPLLPGDSHGPCAFYVTRTQDRPEAPADVTGVVGWNLGKRGGVHWRAGLGLTEHGNTEAAAGQDFSSRRAAVAWIAAQSGAGSR